MAIPHSRKSEINICSVSLKTNKRHRKFKVFTLQRSSSILITAVLVTCISPAIFSQQNEGTQTQDTSETSMNLNSGKESTTNSGINVMTYKNINSQKLAMSFLVK